MRQLFLTFLTVFVFLLPSSKCSDFGKDGFNFYKDYLRARSDVNLPEESLPEKLLYFYRTPVQLHPGIIPSAMQEYKKRTGNAFKNYMLNKDIRAGETVEKRSSKTALSLMLHSKQPYQVFRNISDEEIGDIFQYE